MKKHRKFLIFYGLWLGGIITILTVFDSTEKDKFLITKQRTLCETAASISKDEGAKKLYIKKCCTSIQEDTTGKLQ